MQRYIKYLKMEAKYQEILHFDSYLLCFLTFSHYFCSNIINIFHRMKRLVLITSILINALFCIAQDKVPFNGVVRDIAGNPIKNATVYVSNPRLYASTDKQGRFGLTDVKPYDILHVKIRKHVWQVPVEGRKSIVIVVSEENELNEVSESQELIDIGYGYVKRREHILPGNTISGEELVRTGQTSLLNALAGKVPGLNVYPNASPGGEASVNIRGIHSITLSNTPLFIVDGVERNTLMDISLYDVDYVEIMKDASIYGSRGGNGAIIVHTKK